MDGSGVKPSSAEVLETERRNPMSEAALLRVLADSLDEMEALKLFPADVTDPGTVTVEWTAGSDHPGYAVLSQAISVMVEQHWSALRSQVVKKKETEVQIARKEWSDLALAAPEAAAPVAEPVSGATTGSRVQLVQRQA
jgi:hypothetical protein